MKQVTEQSRPGVLVVDSIFHLLWGEIAHTYSTETAVSLLQIKTTKLSHQVVVSQQIT